MQGQQAGIGGTTSAAVAVQNKALISAMAEYNAIIEAQAKMAQGLTGTQGVR